MCCFLLLFKRTSNAAATSTVARAMAIAVVAKTPTRKTERTISIKKKSEKLYFRQF